MKERPILLSAPMVRAILAGTKMQTRRVVKPIPATDQLLGLVVGSGGFHYIADQTQITYPDLRRIRWDCPYGQPGDMLWVRETWMPDAPRDGTWASTQFYGCAHSPLSEIPERFRKPKHCLFRSTWQGHELTGWKPSIHMPRWASRITLEITGVRVEKLHAISEADAIAEGAPWAACCAPQEGSHKAGFAKLWESINGAGSWDKNPWLWVIEFKRVNP